MAAAILLSGCAPMDDGIDPQTGYLRELPEELVNLADPGQDLAAVQLNAEDGCFWYLYNGPIEATMLPLRTRDGRPICTQTNDG